MNRRDSLFVLCFLALSSACGPRSPAPPTESGDPYTTGWIWCSVYSGATARIAPGEEFPIPEAADGVNGDCLCLDEDTDALRQLQLADWNDGERDDEDWIRFMSGMRSIAVDACETVAEVEWGEDLWFTSCESAAAGHIPFRYDEDGPCQYHDGNID